MKKQKLILLGGGGHCISCIDVILSTDLFEIVGILDPESTPGSKVSDFPVLGSDEMIKDLVEKECQFVITVGQIKNASVREILYQKVKSLGGLLPVIVSANSIVSPSAVLGEGTIVMHNAVINAQAELGKCAIVNTGSIIEHETKVGHFCHISTAATLNGQVKIGNHCMIGSNTVINNNLKITSGVVLGSATVVIKDITEPGIYVGQPAVKKS